MLWVSALRTQSFPTYASWTIVNPCCAHCVRCAGPAMFGLTIPRVAALIQQLPDAARCDKYCGWAEGEQPEVPPLVSGSVRGEGRERGREARGGAGRVCACTHTHAYAVLCTRLQIHAHAHAV